MVLSLVHGVNKTRKHWHWCIFQILFSIPIYPLQRGFYPLKICLIPLNLKRVVYCFTMGVQKKREQSRFTPSFKMQWESLSCWINLDATPISNFQPIRLHDPGCCYKFTYLMANSADPDQLASSEDSWSGSTLFAKAGHIRVQQDKG